MDQSIIVQALKHADTTKEILIGSDVLSQVPELLQRRFGQKRAVIIADENTYAAAGQQLQTEFQSAGMSAGDPLVFPAKPTLHAEFEHVLQVEEFLRPQQAVPVAVGSGTINDLVKLASQRLGRKYMVVGTAASMDGYTAFGASITKDGFKSTMVCDAPVSVVADLGVLARAPAEMNAWGYGDLIGKVSAGADWLLADVVGAEALHPLSFKLVQDSLREAISNPQLLPKGDPQALFNVFGGLVLTGLAIQVCHSSRAASGSEHLFSHLWEMQGTSTPRGGEVSHGTKVGVGTIASLALYEALLEVDFQDLDVEKALESWPSFDRIAEEIKSSLNVPEIVDTAVELSRQKYLTHEQLKARLDTIKRDWPEIKPRLESRLLGVGQVRQMIRDAGGVTSPPEIGVSAGRLRRSYSLARLIRNRYTVLDFCAETGYSSELIGRLFDTGGFWGGI